MIIAGDDMNEALVGANLIMFRDDDEPVPAFRARVSEAGLALGVDTVIFATFPELRWVDDLEQTPEED